MVFAIILLILLFAVLMIYAAYHNIRPRYLITDSALEEQGILDVEFIDSSYTVTADYQRTYPDVTREEYDDYCKYLFDYLNSNGYQVCSYDGTSSELMFIFTFNTKHFTDCDDINSLYSYDGSTFEIYYLYNDDIKGLILSYEDGNATIRLYKDGPFDFFDMCTDEYLPASDESEDAPVIEEPVPAG